MYDRYVADYNYVRPIGVFSLAIMKVGRIQVKFGCKCHVVEIYMQKVDQLIPICRVSMCIG